LKKVANDALLGEADKGYRRRYSKYCIVPTKQPGNTHCTVPTIQYSNALDSEHYSGSFTGSFWS
jgi:hypothetical protein